MERESERERERARQSEREQERARESERALRRNQERAGILLNPATPH